MKIRQLEASQICEHENCSELATEVVFDRDARFIRVMCEIHAEDIIVGSRYSPEYTVHCPNCDCYFGVN